MKWILPILVAALLWPAAALAQAKEFQDCPECPKMVEVPAGKMMRSDKFGAPEFEVTIAKPFAVGKFEVTWAEFDVFVDATKREGKGCNWFSLVGPRPQADKDWNAAFDEAVHIQDETEPVLCVSWDDAKAYVVWLAEKAGKKYRLLTEAEWEWAARAGSPNNSAWWTTANTPQFEMANCADCPGIDTMGREDWLFTFPVGKYQPKKYGVYDMPGIAAEWVEDCVNPSLANAPKDGTAWTQGNCNQRIVRGGSWHHERAFLAGFRQPTPATLRINDIGFRVARDLE